MRTASCSCGQLSVECDGEPVRVSMCFCYACQKRTGSSFGAQARFPKDSVKVKGNATEWVRIGDEGCHITFRFCPTCGAIVFYTIDALDGFIAVPIGVFADSSFPAPTVSVYESRKHAWLPLPETVVDHY